MCSLCDIQTVSFSESEVYDILSNLDPTKAKGIDDIGPMVLRGCSLSLYIPLHHLFTQSLSNSTIPSEWLIHLICPVFKSGDKSNVANYRPISLLCSVQRYLRSLSMINLWIISLLKQICSTSTSNLFAQDFWLPE